MLILTIRTDKPEAEIGLYNDLTRSDYLIWPAERELSDTIHLKLKELLERNKYAYQDLQGIAVYQGPGSFTGLRIGISVANALAYSLDLPIVAEPNETWLDRSLKALMSGTNQTIITPLYGAEPHITKQKK